MFTLRIHNGYFVDGKRVLNGNINDFRYKKYFSLHIENQSLNISVNYQGKSNNSLMIKVIKKYNCTHKNSLM